MRTLLRTAASVLTLLLGAATALPAVVLHGRPWGLGLGLLTAATLLAALPPGWWARLSFALGWAGLVGWAGTTRPEGDYLVAADVSGFVLLGAAPVLVVAALVTLPPPRRSRTVRGGSGESP